MRSHALILLLWITFLHGIASSSFTSVAINYLISVTHWYSRNPRTGSLVLVRGTTEGDSQHYCVQLFPPFLFPNLFRLQYKPDDAVCFLTRWFTQVRCTTGLQLQFYSMESSVWIIHEPFRTCRRIKWKESASLNLVCFTQNSIHCPKSWAVKRWNKRCRHHYSHYQEIHAKTPSV